MYSRRTIPRDRSQPTTSHAKRSSNGWVINLASYLLFVGLLAGLVYVAWINLGVTQNWLLGLLILGVAQILQCLWIYPWKPGLPPRP